MLSIPRLGRSPGEGKGYAFQYSGLENSMDCIVHGSQRIGQDWATFAYHLTENIVFPGNSGGKESACNAGSIPGLGLSPEEVIGYPLQYSWYSLVAETVNNLPAIQEKPVRSLGWEDALEEGKPTHSSILVLRTPIDRAVGESTVYGVSKSWTQVSDQAQHSRTETIDGIKISICPIITMN